MCRSSNGTGAGDQPWRIHAVLATDGSIKAKLSVLGVPAMQDVTVEGQMIGADAFGVLLGNDGTQVATFNATLSDDGSGGSYVLGTGDSGTWSYDVTTRAALQDPNRVIAPAQ